MSRFGAIDRLRDHWLAATGLALALMALVLGLLPGGGEPKTAVLAVRHAVAAGEIVRAGDVVAVPIAAADRTPSMVSRLDGLAGRRRLIGLAGGDFVLRGALRTGTARHCFAVASAPSLSSSRRDRHRICACCGAGRFVDVVILDPNGSRVAARGLELLSPASERAGGVSVTLRAPAAVALALATARGRELRLLLRGERS